MDISGRTPPFSQCSQVTYRCDEGLFPLDVRTSTCTDVGGRGEWVENPGSLVCRERPGKTYLTYDKQYPPFCYSQPTALFLLSHSTVL